MDPEKAKPLLQKTLRSIVYKNGEAKTDAFQGLRQVEEKVREARMVISALPGVGAQLAEQMSSDPDFAANSRRVRLEALAGYCRSALRFLDAGVVKEDKKKLTRAPDVAKLTQVMPDLGPIIRQRWYEAQKCQHASAYLASIIIMGSILEALLLARVQLDPATANRAAAAPRDRSGRIPAFHDWTLGALIDVAAEVGWLKVDRKNFSHALRDSRNVVHPWHQVSTKAAFDQATCEMGWYVLKASVQDLLKSI